MSAAVPITEHADVKTLLSLLRENNIDAKDLTAVLGAVAAMERQLSAAAGELAAMRRELAGMREERNHPMRAILQKAERSLSGMVRGLRSKLKAVRDGIVVGCRRAVAAFRDTGVSALNNLAGFIEIKPALESVRDNLNESIAGAGKSIAKINAASEQYHAAARSIRNIGRAIAGREPVPEIRPNGKLARLLETPFRLELRNLNGSLRSVNKAPAGLDRLEKADAKRKEAARPSTLETMKVLKVKAERRKKEAPAKDKGKEQQTEAAM
jgi:hypothetical protein